MHIVQCVRRSLCYSYVIKLRSLQWLKLIESDLHWVALSIMIVANLGIIEVCHSLLMASVTTSQCFHVTCKFQIWIETNNEYSMNVSYQ